MWVVILTLTLINFKKLIYSKSNRFLIISKNPICAIFCLKQLKDDLTRVICSSSTITDCILAGFHSKVLFMWNCLITHSFTVVEKFPESKELCPNKSDVVCSKIYSFIHFFSGRAAKFLHFTDTNFFADNEF